MRNRTILNLFACLFIVIVIAAPAGGPAAAQDPTPGGRTVTDNEVNQIAHQLYCPVCENIPLDTCPTEACARWRDQIRQQLSDGWTEEEIKDYFVEQYGDRVLAAPPVKGEGRSLNYLIYILPVVIFAAGGYIVVRALTGYYKPAEQRVESQPEAPDEQDEYITRIEEELKKR
jgi:cytochrome c-type biogenesis protein CcmH